MLSFDDSSTWKFRSLLCAFNTYIEFIHLLPFSTIYRCGAAAFEVRVMMAGDEKELSQWNNRSLSSIEGDKTQSWLMSWYQSGSQMKVKVV